MAMFLSSLVIKPIARVWWGGDPDEKDPVSGMSRRDVYNVQKSWADIYAHADENGYLIFTRMFDVDAETKSFFKFLDDATKQQMAESVVFKAHIVSLMSALDSTVHHLGTAPQVSAQIMRKLGQSHRRRRIRRKHFYVLRDVLVDTLKHEMALSDDILAAWGRFVEFIYKHIFETLIE